ncbi:hypothetical protein J2Z48_000177 [Croceifilum oryzae]|uniref:Peptidase C1A papain C-terminal domain-containing protein n=1 Tax=Croceifilum oryzae TaxID=1553429 RepID=A0AAJ1TCS2_9BACL|nr:C1 family peptidase [Croceifilum oryzae]MDQ0416019.1 hypothetical protein [Croceifilum oryzae]
MKKSLLWVLASVFTLTSTLIGTSSAGAEPAKKPFNPNDFSTYGTGLKDAPIPKDMQAYAPPKRFSQQALPTKIDLRQYFAPIRSQSKFGTCVAFATTGLREYYIGRYTAARGSDVTHLSPSYIYYPSGAEDGMSFYSAFDTLIKEGVPPETERLYDPNRENKDQFKAPITALQRKNAAPYKISTFRYIYKNSSMVSNIKQAVANGDPVMIGIPVYPNFDATPSTGIIPAVGEKKSRGGHALVVAGYDDENEWFIVRNSWGDKFGDKGYAYMKYDIFFEMTNAYAYVATVNNNQYPPQGVKFSVSSKTDTTVTLSASGLQAVSYDLYRNGKYTKSFTGGRVTDVGLEPGATYEYYVMARNYRGDTRSFTVKEETMQNIQPVKVKLDKAS